MGPFWQKTFTGIFLAKNNSFAVRSKASIVAFVLEASTLPPVIVSQFYLSPCNSYWISTPVPYPLSLKNKDDKLVWRQLQFSSISTPPIEVKIPAFQQFLLFCFGLENWNHWFVFKLRLGASIPCLLPPNMLRLFRHAPPLSTFWRPYMLRLIQDFENLTCSASKISYILLIGHRVACPLFKTELGKNAQLKTIEYAPALRLNQRPN